MRPNPYQTFGLPSGADSRKRIPRSISAAEVLFAFGLICTALAAGLVQFVMIGLIGLFLFVVSFGLLLAAGLFLRANGQPPWWRRAASFALYAVAVLSSIATSAYATSLAFDHVMAPGAGATTPSGLQWAVLILIS